MQPNQQSPPCREATTIPIPIPHSCYHHRCTTSDQAASTKCVSDQAWTPHTAPNALQAPRITTRSPSRPPQRPEDKSLAAAKPAEHRLPPAGVLYAKGKWASGPVVLCVLLTLLGWLPGVVYAFIIGSRSRRERQGRRSAPASPWGRKGEKERKRSRTGKVTNG